MEKRNPQTKEELIAIIQESQQKIGYDVREKLMNSVWLCVLRIREIWWSTKTQL